MVKVIIVLVGKDDWIEKAIFNRSCVAVTDGSYMRELYPNVCSAAFIFECTDGTGRLIGSFPEKTVSENAYRGELLGLTAIHIILRSINEIAPKQSEIIVTNPLNAGAILFMLSRIRFIAISPSSSPWYAFSKTVVSGDKPIILPVTSVHSKIKAVEKTFGYNSLM